MRIQLLAKSLLRFYLLNMKGPLQITFGRGEPFKEVLLRNNYDLFINLLHDLHVAHSLFVVQLRNSERFTTVMLSRIFFISTKFVTQ